MLKKSIENTQTQLFPILWILLKNTELSNFAIGKSAYVNDGIIPAFKAFGIGAALSLPWALGNLLFGAHSSWVQYWWHPIIALNPGIAEEAWSRMLLVPVIYLILRRYSSVSQSFYLSILIAGFWFSYLHASNELIGIVVMTPLMTIMFALTLSSIIFYKNLEMAIGFHFFIDFIKYFVSFLLNNDLWI